MKFMKNLIHEAIIFATQKHGNAKRKGTDIPYITHPMEVMQILSENSYSKKVIIAGILHDTLEDTDTSREEIMNIFGEDVLFIIDAESEDKSKTWHERKQATIDHLQTASIEIKAVCLADKLANLRSMSTDHETEGENLWNRFNASKADIEWYYRSVFNKLSNLNNNMCSEYEELLEKVFK